MTKDIRDLFRVEGWSLHCNLCGKDVFKDPNDYFMLKNEVWDEVCDNDYISGTDVLCKSCVEKILGRKLSREDYTDAPVNDSNIMEFNNDKDTNRTMA